MSDFRPPKGQSCRNCRCFERNCDDDSAGVCYAEAPSLFWNIPIEQRIDEEVLDGYIGCDEDTWCGHWHGNADVRCRACRWHREAECPRSAYSFGGTLTVIELAPADHAFACERYEEE